MMAINLPCNPCANEFCGNCVGEKLEVAGFIHDASFHCACANKGHPNRITKDRPNKDIFSKKKDTEPAHRTEIQSDADFEEEE